MGTYSSLTKRERIEQLERIINATADRPWVLRLADLERTIAHLAKEEDLKQHNGRLEQHTRRIEYLEKHLSILVDAIEDGDGLSWGDRLTRLEQRQTQYHVLLDTLRAEINTPQWAPPTEVILEVKEIQRDHTKVVEYIDRLAKRIDAFDGQGHLPYTDAQREADAIRPKAVQEILLDWGGDPDFVHEVAQKIIDRLAILDRQPSRPSPPLPTDWTGVGAHLDEKRT